jgi:urease accessory protein
MRILLAIAVLITMPSLAFAHTGHAEASSLMHGFGHPLGGLDHVLAMFAVGLFAFVLGGRALWLVPMSFVAMMVIGFGLGLWRVELPFVELAIALSSIIIGAVATLRRAIPTPAAMALVGMFAMFHGVAHGAEMPSTAAGLDYAAGFVLATALLHLAGIAAGVIGAKLTDKRTNVIAQSAAGLTALGGVGILAGWL